MLSVSTPSCSMPKFAHGSSSVLRFEMSSPVVLPSEAGELPASCGNAANVMTKVPLIAMASLVAEEVFRKRKRNVAHSARGCRTFERFEMVFLVATA